VAVANPPVFHGEVDDVLCSFDIDGVGAQAAARHERIVGLNLAGLQHELALVRAFKGAYGLNLLDLGGR
jgi:hypothetical protein